MPLPCCVLCPHNIALLLEKSYLYTNNNVLKRVFKVEQFHVESNFNIIFQGCVDFLMTLSGPQWARSSLLVVTTSRKQVMTPLTAHWQVVGQGSTPLQHHWYPGLNLYVVLFPITASSALWFPTWPGSFKDLPRSWLLTTFKVIWVKTSKICGPLNNGLIWDLNRNPMTGNNSGRFSVSFFEGRISWWHKWVDSKLW